MYLFQPSSAAANLEIRGEYAKVLSDPLNLLSARSASSLAFLASAAILFTRSQAEYGLHEQCELDDDTTTSL